MDHGRTSTSCGTKTRALASAGSVDCRKKTPTLAISRARTTGVTGGTSEAWIAAGGATMAPTGRRRPTLHPVLPLLRHPDVRGEAGVRDGVREHQVAEGARAPHPPVVDDAREQPDLPVRPVLA